MRGASRRNRDRAEKISLYDSYECTFFPFARHNTWAEHVVLVKQIENDAAIGEDETTPAIHRVLRDLHVNRGW